MGLQEDDDDLRVPSTCDLKTPAMDNDITNDTNDISLIKHTTDNNNNTTETATLVPPLFAAGSTHHAAVSSSRRTFSADFHLYVDQEALDRFTTASLSLSSFSAAAPLTPTFQSLLSTPTGASAPTSYFDDDHHHQLDCDWMNRSFQPDEFAKILTAPVLVDFDSTASSASSSPGRVEGEGQEEEEEESDGEVDSEVDVVALEQQQQKIDVSQVSFESLINLGDLPAPLPLPLSTSSEASASSKKRGRPPKEVPVAAISARPAKKARAGTVEPSTPAAGTKPHAIARPLSNDPEEIEKYIKYRQSNNEAACKSRLRRKERERENAERVVVLEAQNASLKKELSSLQDQVATLKALLDSHLKSKAR